MTTENEEEVVGTPVLMPKDLTKTAEPTASVPREQKPSEDDSVRAVLKENGVKKVERPVVEKVKANMWEFDAKVKAAFFMLFRNGLTVIGAVVVLLIAFLGTAWYTGTPIDHMKDSITASFKASALSYAEREEVLTLGDIDHPNASEVSRFFKLVGKARAANEIWAVKAYGQTMNERVDELIRVTSNKWTGWGEASATRAWCMNMRSFGYPQEYTSEAVSRAAMGENVDISAIYAVATPTK